MKITLAKLENLINEELRALNEAPSMPWEDDFGWDDVGGWAKTAAIGGPSSAIALAHAKTVGAASGELTKVAWNKLGPSNAQIIAYLDTWAMEHPTVKKLVASEGRGITRYLLKNLPEPTKSITLTPYKGKNVSIKVILDTDGDASVILQASFARQGVTLKYDLDDLLLNYLSTDSGFDTWTAGFASSIIEQLEPMIHNLVATKDTLDKGVKFITTAGGLLGDEEDEGDGEEETLDVQAVIKDVRRRINGQITRNIVPRKSEIISGVEEIFDGVKSFVEDHPSYIVAHYVAQWMSTLDVPGDWQSEWETKAAKEIAEMIESEMESADLFTKIGKALQPLDRAIEQQFGMNENIHNQKIAMTKTEIRQIIREELKIGFERLPGGSYKMYDPDPDDSTFTISAEPLRNSEVRLKIEEYLGFDSEKDIDRFLRIHNEPLSMIFWHAQKQGGELLSAWDNAKDYIDTMSEKDMLMKNRPIRQKRIAKQIISEDVDRDS